MVLLLAAVAFTILLNEILREHGRTSKLALAVGGDAKGKVSIGLYVAAIPLAFVSPWIADAIYVSVAMIWLVPDRRIERKLRD